MVVYKILLACNNNSVLSPMAEGLFRHYCRVNTEVYCAGTELAPLDQDMIKVMAKEGINIKDVKQNLISDLKHIDFDYIITFDSESEKESHHFPSRPVKYHFQLDQYLHNDDLDDKTELYRNLSNKMKKIIQSFIKEYFSLEKPL
jgi:protein-tyrosine-phosphatase